MVAEAEALFGDAAAELLKAAGFEVFQASDGEEALMLLKEHPRISLLVSDVRMPHMDGYALVEAGLRLNPNLQVILMTGIQAYRRNMCRTARSIPCASRSTWMFCAAMPKI